MVLADPRAPDGSPAHQHACLIYSDDASRDAALASYVIEGLAGHERIVAIAEPADRTALVARLEANGCATADRIRDGSLRLPTVAETYLRDGSFDPARMIGTFRALADESDRAGFAGLRITGSGAWALSAGRVADLLAYERRIEDLFEERAHLNALCQYDERLFDPAVLAEVLRTHPLVIYDGVPGPNPFHMPRGDDAVQVRSMLGRLREARRLVASAESARAQAEMIIDDAADGILICTSEGEIAGANGQLCGLLGLSERELVGRRIRDLLLDDLALVPLMTERVATGERVTTHRHLRSATGSGIPVDVTAARIPDGRVMAIVRDARPRLAAEERAEADARADKLRALGGMAGGIAHDLNQSLGLIVGHAELAAEADDPRPEIDGIIRAATDAASTIRALLRFARPDAAEPRTAVDVTQLLADVLAFTRPRWSEQARAEGGPITVRLDAQDALVVVAEPGAVRHAVTNLVLNALDAMPRGGALTLRGRRDATDVVIEVEDTGTGIDPAHLDRLGEPFFTTKHERGNGLGLAMVYSVAAAHGGRVDVATRLGEGTTFSLVLPSVASGPPARKPPAPGASAAPRRVLLVDDQELLLAVMARMLRREGHAVEAARSGEEALDILERFPADVVVSDVTMGPGMTGWDLAKAVRAHWPDIRFYLASGWAPAIGDEDGTADLVDGLLAKPVARDTLLDAVRSAPVRG